MMKSSKKISIFLLAFLAVLIFSCREKIIDPVDNYTPTPYTFVTPQGFTPPILPQDNPLTYEGIKVGRHIFYDPRMSIDQSISCADCHEPTTGFSDSSRVSEGVDGRLGKRNSMPLFNLAWFKEYMWDGAAISIYNQILIPWTSHIEMAVTPQEIPQVLERFQNDAAFVSMYKGAFGTETVTMENVLKSLEQFLLTMISSNSKYDKYIRGEASLTPDEKEGMNIFLRIDDAPGSGECNHCHTLGANFTDSKFRNNGLDRHPLDTGRGLITLNVLDYYKFKTPSVRNLSFTAPYMHDGRFRTLDEVLDFYNNGIDTLSPNIDPNLLNHKNLIGRLNNKQVAQLKAFLLSLDDPDFFTNPDYQKP